MRRCLFVILSLLIISNFVSADIASMLNKIGVEPTELSANGDSVVDYSGIPILIRTQKGEVKHIGRKLFADGFRQFNDRGVLEYVEAAYLNQLLKLEDRRFSNISFEKGSWADLECVNDSTGCSITIINSKKYSVEWSDETACFVKLVFPIEYDKIKPVAGRSELEENFISELKDYQLSDRKEAHLNMDKLQALNDTVYLLAGDSYMISDVRGDLYYKADEQGNLALLYDSDYPAESIANLFVAGYSGDDDVTIDMTILRHEYGKTQKESVNIRQLVEYCKSQGCQPYWGVESMSEDSLKGTLFMYNQHEGYDHLFRVECPIKDMTTGQIRIKARVSLFVPTNNVNNLFEQYEEAENNEKPRFEVK